MRKGMRLLVGYDGSSCADAAIDGLEKAGFPSRMDVRVLSAADVFLPVGRGAKVPDPIKATIERSRVAAKEQVDQAASRARTGARRIKRIFPGWRVGYESCADSPAWALVKKAGSWSPDLIVVGAHGHARAGRFFGSVSQMVVTQADCSVRVGRSSSNPGGKEPRVLIAIDGSPGSAAAVRAVQRREWPSGTHFLMMSVIDPRKSTFIERLAPAEIRWFLEQASDDRRAVGRMLESFAKTFRAEYAHVSCQIRTGDPKRIIVKEAESWKADSIFIGARGLTHLKRFFTGGVSAAVAARAHCSVEVIREGV